MRPRRRRRRERTGRAAARPEDPAAAARAPAPTDEHDRDRDHEVPGRSARARTSRGGAHADPPWPSPRPNQSSTARDTPSADRGACCSPDPVEGRPPASNSASVAGSEGAVRLDDPTASAGRRAACARSRAARSRERADVDRIAQRRDVSPRTVTTSAVTDRGGPLAHPRARPAAAYRPYPPSSADGGRRLASIESHAARPPRWRSRRARRTARRRSLAARPGLPAHARGPRQGREGGVPEGGVRAARLRITRRSSSCARMRRSIPSSRARRSRYVSSVTDDVNGRTMAMAIP